MIKIKKNSSNNIVTFPKKPNSFEKEVDRTIAWDHRILQSLI